MTEWLKNLFVSIFGTNSSLATLIISMVPIIELRGAIPFGSAVSLWGENALPLWKSFLFSVLGCSIVCVILTFLFWPLFKWLKSTKGFKKLANAIENKLNRSSKSINDKVQEEKNEKKTRLIKWLGVFVFVAIPLPLTGVWTGTCVALFIGLSKKDTMLSVILGNMVAGLIMLVISYFFADNTMIVLWFFLALVAVFAAFFAVKAIVKKIKDKKKKPQNNQVEFKDNEGLNESLNESSDEKSDEGSDETLKSVEKSDETLKSVENSDETSKLAQNSDEKMIDGEVEKITEKTTEKIAKKSAKNAVK